MKTEASRYASKTLGSLATVAANLDRAKQALPDHPLRTQVAEALAKSRGFAEQSHEYALMALELIELNERQSVKAPAAPETSS